MLLFIVLNYLLWDRQNKIVQDSSKDATISALGREIQNMESVEDLLRQRANKLESDLKSSKDEVNGLNNEKGKLQTSLSLKNEIIDQLKQSANLSAPEETINNWLDIVSSGEFEKAYHLQTSTVLGQQISQDEFVKQFKSKIKSLKSSSKPTLQPLTEEKKGDIVFLVSVQVERIPDSGKFIFEEGKNDRMFTLVFNKEKNAWLISSIE